MAMPPPGECAVHLRAPAMAAAPREGATKMAVRESKGELGCRKRQHVAGAQVDVLEVESHTRRNSGRWR